MSRNSLLRSQVEKKEQGNKPKELQRKKGKNQQNYGNMENNIIGYFEKETGGHLWLKSESRDIVIEFNNTEFVGDLDGEFQKCGRQTSD